MKFSAQTPELPGFQITPMIDVVFLLLTFFVTATLYSSWESEVHIQLPTAGSAKVTDRLPGEVVVNLGKDGSIVINQVPITLAELREKCEMLSVNFPGHPIIIRADEKTEYGSIMAVIDACRLAGIANISFATAMTNEEL
jgi:biopolymer transport protein ExbD